MAVKFAVAGVALVVEPFGFRTPVDVLLGFPDVGAAAGKTEGLEAHRFQRNVAGEDEQIGPGDLPAVFLLDRPQQPARLVEVGVVGPAIERRETLLTGAGAAAAVTDAIGARAVPGHADEQWAVMAEIGRPPVLRIRHHLVQILDHRIEIEGLEFLGVVEALAHRVREVRLLVQNAKIELVRPPITVRGFAGPMHDRALAGVVSIMSIHIFFSDCGYVDWTVLETVLEIALRIVLGTNLGTVLRQWS